MPSENIKSRVRRALVESLWTLGLDGFQQASIVAKKRAVADEGMLAPGIIVSPSRVERQRSPAGMRVRTIESLVTVYFRPNGQGLPDREGQEAVTETILAAFDLPPEMPASLVAIVPEVQEVRATTRDEFLAATYPYLADVHRILVTVEVCQLAGVAA